MTGSTLFTVMSTVVDLLSISSQPTYFTVNWCSPAPRSRVSMVKLAMYLELAEFNSGTTRWVSSFPDASQTTQ